MKINKELLKGSTVIVILNLLNQRAMYGYEMIKEIERKSNGVFAFKEGTLYPILHSLESDGMIQSYWEETEGNRKRKYYRITDEGRKHIKEKHEEWTLFKTAMDNVLKEEIAWK